MRMSHAHEPRTADDRPAPPGPECNEEVLPLGRAKISTNLRRGRPEAVSVHIRILRNVACATAPSPSQ